MSGPTRFRVRNCVRVENLSHAIQTATERAAMREKARALGEKIQQEDGVAEAVKWMEHYLA